MLPISDDNRGRRSVPVVTYVLIALNVLVYIYEFLLSDRQLSAFFNDWAVIPDEISNGQAYYTILTAAFLHGSWFHLGSNMLFLWIFGDNVEDVMGHARYLIFYLLTAVGASLAQVFIDPNSTVPMVGASGAISGVLAAYIVLFPRGRIVTLIVLGVFFTATMLPAWVMIGYWIVLQVISGVGSLGGMQDGGGVAFFAHIGGFIAGLVLVWFFRDKQRQEAQRIARAGGYAERRWPQAR
jgi:membrane associated rhomboid family serine protease